MEKVLPFAAGANNGGADSNNNIFTIKNTKIYFPIVILSEPGN